MSEKVFKDIKRAIAFIAHPLTGGKTDRPSMIVHLKAFDGAHNALTPDELEEAKRQAIEALDELKATHPQGVIPRRKTIFTRFMEKNLGLSTEGEDPSQSDLRGR